MKKVKKDFEKSPLPARSPARSNLAGLSRTIGKPLGYTIGEAFWSFKVTGKGIAGNNTNLFSLMAAIIKKTRVSIASQIFFCRDLIFYSRFLPFRFDELDRVEVNIRNQILQIPVALGVLGSVFPLKQSAHAFIASIKIHCVRSSELLHKTADAALGMFMRENMKVVGHKTVSIQVDERISAVHLERLFQQGRTLLGGLFYIVDAHIQGAVAKVKKSQKPFVIGLVHKYFSLLGSSVVEVIKLAGSQYSFSAHIFVQRHYTHIQLSSKVRPCWDSMLTRGNNRYVGSYVGN